MPAPSRKRRSRVLLYDSELPLKPRELRTTTSVSEDLSQIELEFCYRWTSCYQPARAAIQAGYNPASAHFTARRLLADARVQRQVALIESDRLRRLKFDGDKFLAQELLLASADVAAELQEVWVPPCRYCWGRNFEYQRTHAEFQEDLEAWMRLPDRRRRRQPVTAELSRAEVVVYDDTDKKLPFDERGGDGYDVALPPNPGCPNCRGRGLEVPGHGSLVHIRQRDTRELSPVGRLLFAGAKYGPRGVEVMVRSQDAARTRLMNLLGKFLELRANGKVPALSFGVGVDSKVADLLTDDFRSLTDQQLDVYLASNGVVIDDLEGGEGEDSRGYPGEAPPPGYVA